jgi:heptosyltransferase-2
MTPDPISILVVAPNWLGDAVMALPAIADARRRYPSARLYAAARPGVADLLRLAPDVDEVITLHWHGALWRRAALRADAERLRATGAAVALLLPNSFASAYLVHQAGIAERWGYASDLRARLLTRAVPRPKRRGLHQAQYYQYLTTELAMEPGPLEPTIVLPPDAVDAARALLAQYGWNSRSRLITFAPGAAYGRAKQWVPSYVSRLVTTLASEHDATCVLVGSRADRDSTTQICGAVPEPHRRKVINLSGATSIAQLAAVLAASQACVANDSGAMHVAAALGVPTVAIFGPTIVEATRPLVRAGGRADVLTHRVWCRPCMLRECPIDHRCMTGITPERVLATLEAMQ